jgi:hypothetical protein
MEISNFKTQISKKYQILKFKLFAVWAFEFYLKFDVWFLKFKIAGA